jgi:L,D-transpeptidase catalytic domain
MKFARLLIIIVLTGAAIYALANMYQHKRIFSRAVPAAGSSNKQIKKSLNLQQKAKEAKAFAAKNNFNTQVCFLVNLNLPSGSNRFFIYDLQKDSIRKSGLVTHGSGRTSTDGKPVFSNTPNSLCSALGKYKIGNSYYGQFGLAFKLYGLDKTNSKAFERAIVLHSHECVPDTETEPYTICESWGCPTVSPAFLNNLKSIINASKKPVLLWIYETPNP